MRSTHGNRPRTAPSPAPSTQTLPDPRTVMTLPNFLIIGTNKGGTTSLYYFLRKHPEIFMSPVKEPQFFAMDAPEGDPRVPGARWDTVTTMAEYEDLFSEAGAATAIGEATTSYLYNELAPERIHHHIPSVKMIAILRDPIERAYSNYLHNVRDGHEPISDFGQAIAAEGCNGRIMGRLNYRDKGLYAQQLDRYFALFPREQFRFFLYEDFDESPGPVLRHIYEFLNVDAKFEQDLDVRLNVGGVPKSKRLQSALNRQEKLKWAVDPYVPGWLRRRLLRSQARNLSKPPISADLRREMIEFFRDDTARVADLTGLDVTRWQTAPASV